ncbi:MAG TPA: nickel pincer cofactor biosynthesis protein LarB [Nitrososphaeraceae archaeon]|jgi:NCAIR mutase (PurE)-related protein|nr:nickel pincer cofactor biosynthesis protein LarB [Nitrososphaeraceae archaeon]
MELKAILNKFAEGRLSIDEVQKQISIHSIEYVRNNLAQLDMGREIRKGVPEVVFAEGKEYSDIVRIILSAIRKKEKVMVSRIKRDELSKLCKDLKKRNLVLEIGKYSTTILVSQGNHRQTTRTGAKIGILTAGTSDIGVAEEARLVAKAMGCDVIFRYDVGIAGIHRLFSPLEEMINKNVDAIVVVAGMEGALASIVSSIVDVPVVGVPTSIGYGFGSDGMAALASMLQSCAFGLAVVNIDNGVGAGAFAASIANRMVRKRKDKI